MRAFDGTRSLLTVENRSQLTFIFFDWSDKNCCSISYEKWGKTDNLLVTQNLAHSYFIPCFSSYLLVTSSDTSAVIRTPSSRVRIVVSWKKYYKLSTAEPKLAEIALKWPKLLRKHHILMYFYYYFWPLNNDRLNLRTNPHNISVMQQRFSLVSLGYLWSLLYAFPCEIPTVVWCPKSRACIRIWVRAMISLKNSHFGFATHDESKFKKHLQ